MTAWSLPLAADDPSRSALAVDAIADSIEAERFKGFGRQEPMVAALLWLLEVIKWSPSTLKIVHALPHQPDAFTLADLRATMMRLKIASSESVLGRRQIEDLPVPSLLITPKGQALVLEHEPHVGKVAYDPVSGQEIIPPTDPKLKVVVFHRPAIRVPQDFTIGLVRRFNRTALRLLVIKGGLNLLAIAAVLALVMVYDTVVPAHANDTLIALCVAVAVALGLDLFLRRTKARLLSRTTARMEYIIGVTAFRKVLSLSFDRIAANSIPQQVSRLRQFMTVGSVLSGPAAEIALELPFTVLMIIALFAIGGPIGFVPILVFVLFALAAAVLGPRLRRLGTAARVTREAHEEIVSEIILQTDAIRDCGGQDIWETRARESGERQIEAQRRVDSGQLILNGISAASMPLAGGATAIIGSHLAIQGSLSAGALIGAMVLTWRIIAPLQAMLLLIAKWADLRRMSGQLDRLMRLKSEPPSMQTPLTFDPRGQLSFRRLAFRYTAGSDAVLRGLTADLPAGALIAITGPSGAGKTTLLRAVLGIIKPMDGAVLIDGVNLNQIPQGQLRELVSYVPQNPILIHGTIAQNLRLARPLASDEDLRAVLDELGLTNALACLPDGLETRLTEEVQAILPAGFRQCLALAQAFLRKPKFLLLDEPARLLDPSLERAVMASLRRRRGRVTTLMVSHRPSHVRAADLVMNLEAGSIRHLGEPK
ncbi:MAG: ATP-binding cassette domain-containing protein [Pseudomonadota bacterium]